MRFKILRLFAATLIAGLPAASWAQTLGNATAEARARMACGGAQLVSANYAPGGLLRVTCRQQGQNSRSATQQAANLTGTGLGANAALGGVLTVGFIALVSGSSNEAETTGTTSVTSTSTTGGVDALSR